MLNIILFLLLIILLFISYFLFNKEGFTNNDVVSISINDINDMANYVDIENGVLRDSPIYYKLIELNTDDSNLNNRIKTMGLYLIMDSTGGYFNYDSSNKKWIKNNSQITVNSMATSYYMFAYDPHRMNDMFPERTDEFISTFGSLDNTFIIGYKNIKIQK